MAQSTTPAEVLTEATLRLKARVAIAVDEAIKEFEVTIGMSPSAIDVPLIDVPTMGDRFRRRVVGHVSVSFDQL